MAAQRLLVLLALGAGGWGWGLLPAMGAPVVWPQPACLDAAGQPVDWWLQVKTPGVCEGGPWQRGNTTLYTDARAITGWRCRWFGGHCWTLESIDRCACARSTRATACHACHSQQACWLAGAGQVKLTGLRTPPAPTAVGPMVPCNARWHSCLCLARGAHSITTSRPTPKTSTTTSELLAATRMPMQAAAGTPGCEPLPLPPPPPPLPAETTSASRMPRACWGWGQRGACGSGTASPSSPTTQTPGLTGRLQNLPRCAGKRGGQRPGTAPCTLLQHDTDTCRPCPPPSCLLRHAMARSFSAPRSGQAR